MIQFKTEDLLVIDIETAPNYFSYEEMPEAWQQLWTGKVERTLPESVTAAEYYSKRAGIMAEFARIVCISIGMIHHDGVNKLLIKSFYGLDEKKILQEFIAVVQQVQSKNSRFVFAGHNIKEFDIPFICRRMIIHNIPLPNFMNFQNMKPWDTNIVDSFQYWRFGDYKNFTSLKLLAACLNIPSPKDDIDGSMVAELYWTKDEEQRKKNLDRIAQYCQKDVQATTNILLHFKNEEKITDENIEFRPPEVFV